MAEQEADRLAQLRDSARGWHGVQLAVLGFIGLCGVLQSGAAGDNPQWLEIVAGLLVLLALALACIATGLVASAAWPVYGNPKARDSVAEENEALRTGRRLRTGIGTTYLAVIVLAVAATSGWWPGDAGQPAFVEVSTSEATLCGTLRSAEPGLVGLDVEGQPTVVALSEVVQLRPLDSCT